MPVASARRGGDAAIASRGRARGWLGLAGWVAACTPAPTQTPAETKEAGAVEAATSVAAPERPAAERCADAGCWARLAEEAGRLGIDDVAASHLGQAFRREPTAARLGAWIDALVVGGEVRRAREGLAGARALGEQRGDRGLVAEVERRLAGLPAARGGSLDVPALTSAQQAAYAAEAAGRIDEAARGLAAGHAGEPVHQAHAGSLLARGGEWAAARRLWSAARAGLYERGAEVRIEAMETWFTTTAAWRGDELALMRLYSSLETLQDQIGALQLLSGAGTRRTLYFPRPSQVVGFTADGQGFLRDEEGSLVLSDLLSGTQSRVVARPGGRISSVETDGSGDDLLVLATGEGGAGLWDARGQQVARFMLKGTTPTITRVYTGEGAEHDNILDDSPTWPVALAMTPGAKLVAVGGSDSKVRVFDRAGKQLQLLEFQWQYRERRHMGGNPDQNVPLSLRFDPKERLVAVYTRGDIYVWDPRTGKVVQHHEGRCEPAEGAAHANRYAEPGAPRKQPTDEELVACGYATEGSVSPDGSTVVTGGALSGFRVRSVASGRTQFFVVSNELPDQHLVLSGSGSVGLANLYGAAAVWRPGSQAVETLAPAAASGPITPTLARDGRILRASMSRTDRFWDLQTGEPIVVTKGKEYVVAASDDLRWVVVHAGGAVEVREVLTGKVTFARAISNQSVYGLVVSGGRASIHLSDGTGKLDVILVEPDGKSAAQVMQDETPSALSEDGRWLATVEFQGRTPRTRVRGVRMAGKVLHTLEGTRQVVFSRDGERMAWFYMADAERPEVTVREQSVEPHGPAGPSGRGDVRELVLQGWPEHLSYAPDGAELLVLLESGRLTRWRPASGERREHAQVSLILPSGSRVADDGRTVWFPGYGHVQVRSNDAELRRLATLYPLLGGGWLVVSRSGAVDGSDDAVDSVVTRVKQGATTRVFDGRLGWDGAFVAGTLGRALAGEDVAPPVLVRPPPGPEEELGLGR